MSTEETCQLCLERIDRSDFNLGGYRTGQRRDVTVDHLWSYLYHQNVRECFSPSTATGVSADGLAKELGLPKLTFSFSMAGPASLTASDKDETSSVRMCEECSAEFEKLDQLHNQLERVKKSVEHQILSINNRIHGRNSYIPSVLSGAARNLEMSFGGSTIGKENVARALRFLGQMCNDGCPSSTNENLSIGPIDEETETGALLQEEGLSKKSQSQTMKREGSSSFTSSNIMNASIEPENTFSSIITVSGTEAPLIVSPLSTASAEGRFVMEVDTENAEYHTQVIKLEPESENSEIPANMNADYQIPATVKAPNRTKSSFKNDCSNSKRSSRKARLPSAPEQAHRSAAAINTSRKVGKDSIEIIKSGNKKMDYNCTICGKGFIKNFILLRHTRTHTGEKPFTCDICQVKFADLGNLKVHRRIHTGEKPFACEFCQRQFTTKSILQGHRRIHTGEKPFECEICKGNFSEKSNLQRHLLVHSEERPYKCSICNRAFSRKDKRNRHQNLHSHEKNTLSKLDQN